MKTFYYCQQKECSRVATVICVKSIENETFRLSVCDQHVSWGYDELNKLEPIVALTIEAVQK